MRLSAGPQKNVVRRQFVTQLWGTDSRGKVNQSLGADGLAWGSRNPRSPHAPPHPLSLVFASLLSGIPAAAQEPGFARPNLVLKEGVTRMPRGDTQEVRVLVASFRPGERTVFHRDHSPVTVVILGGALTLDSGGCRPLGNSVGGQSLDGAGLHPCQGLMTAAPAASKGPGSRVATAKPLAAAMAAM